MARRSLGVMAGSLANTSVLGVLVAALASITIIYAWKFQSMVRARRLWLYFTSAVTLSMAAVYCFLLLSALGRGQTTCILICYPLMGGSMVCSGRWLEMLCRLAPRPPVQRAEQELSPEGRAGG